MARRKKRFNFVFLLIGLALVAATWFAADFYFNNYQNRQKEIVPVEIVDEPAAKTEKPAAAKEDDSPALENGFKSETYRDGRFGFEFQYPVFAAGDSRCPKIEKTSDGFSLGNFSFLAIAKSGALADFIDSELQGMSIDDRKTITVGGVAAENIDYQTGGMGWYGSDTFIEHNGKFFEFGLLANESSDKCGGIDDYEDRVYQAVISTLKFTD